MTGLMEKAGGDAKKFAALLTKLVAKYPKVIKVKKSEQQEMMDRIMRESKENPKAADDDAAADDAVGTDNGGEDNLDNLLEEL